MVGNGFDEDRTPARRTPEERPQLPADRAVLIVEDDEPAQLLMQRLLPDSYDVSVAAGMDSALAAVETSDFDLVLMDIGLKGDRDGVNLLHQMQALDTWTDARAIAVTAHALPGDRERMLSAGFDGYVAKPFTQDQFLGAIREVLA